jgi:hypothetical protein
MVSVSLFFPPRRDKKPFLSRSVLPFLVGTNRLQQTIEQTGLFFSVGHNPFYPQGVKDLLSNVAPAVHDIVNVLE